MTTNTGTTTYRVNFAIRTIKRYEITSGHPTISRSFCNCFENDDYEQVAARVYKRALADPELMRKIPFFLSLDKLKESYKKEQAK